MSGEESCRPLHRGRDACDRCGWLRDEGRPAARLPAPSWREVRERERQAFLDLLREQHAIIRGLVDVISMLLAARRRAEAAARALDRVTDQLAAFEARHDAGDKPGAALAMRAWIAKVAP